MTTLVPAKPHKGCMHRILLFLMWTLIVIVALGTLVVLVAPKKEGVASQPSAPLYTVIPPTVTPEWMAPPFAEICGSNNKLTEIQQTARVKAMEGKKIAGWDGKVYDVAKDGEKYKVEIDAEGGIFSARQLVLEDLPESVANLNVGQTVFYSGTIQTIDVAFGVICNPMTVVSATLKAK